MTASEYWDSGEPPATERQPTFHGRLKMEDFKFNAGSASQSGSLSPSTLLRRSPRRSTPTAPLLASPSPPSPSSSTRHTLKRKSPSTTTTTTTTDSPSPSPSKKLTSSSTRRKRKSGYAPPSTYAHLPPLPDILAPDLLILFIGLNPGLQTSLSGHAYAHPSNLFWKLLHSSGLTPTPCRPSEDRTLPARFRLGSTNIVARPSRSGAELRRAELDAGVAVLEDKCRRWRPEAVCVVGKSIWESVWRVRHGGKGIGRAEFQYGWQDARENMGRLRPGVDDPDDVADGVAVGSGWAGARVFVASSTSGLAASLSPAEKEGIWRELGAWAEGRREEMGIRKEDLK